MQTADVGSLFENFVLLILTLTVKDEQLVASVKLNFISEAA